MPTPAIAGAEESGWNAGKPKGFPAGRESIGS